MIITGAIAATAMAGGVKNAISYDSFKFGNNYYHVITADIASGACSPSMVSSPQLTSVWNLVGQRHPIVAITGTFFSPASQTPVADVLVNGKLVARGSRGTAIGVNFTGTQVDIFDQPFSKTIDWSSYRFGLRGAVRIVDGGRVMPDPKSQRFHDKHIWGRASRTGLGITTSGKLCLFATREKITLRQLGYAMKSRGIRNGVSLDGGGSTCLYYKGAMLIPPQRKLCNMFVICGRPADIAEGFDMGLPSMPRASAQNARG